MQVIVYFSVSCHHLHCFNTDIFISGVHLLSTLNQRPQLLGFH